MARGLSSFLLQLLTLAACARAHSFVQKVETETETYDNIRKNIGWDSKGGRIGTFVDQSSYSTPDIVCGDKYEPGTEYATVAAGSTLKLCWARWPASHRGPIIDYLASCGDDCAGIDKTKLEWFKVAEAGLLETPRAPNAAKNDPRIGYWASDKLIDSGDLGGIPSHSDEPESMNPCWEVKVPNVKPGKYTWRTEIIALFPSGGQTQHYPRCINFDITGDGTLSPQGVPASQLYKATDPGITARSNSRLTEYPIPGPPLIDGGSSGSIPPNNTVVSPAEESEADSTSPTPTPASAAEGTEPTTFVTSSRTGRATATRTSPSSTRSPNTRGGRASKAAQPTRTRRSRPTASSTEEPCKHQTKA